MDKKYLLTLGFRSSLGLGWLPKQGSGTSPNRGTGRSHRSEGKALAEKERQAQEEAKKASLAQEAGAIG